MDYLALRPKRRPHQCAVAGCRSRRLEPGRKYCRRCRWARYRITHPYKVAFKDLRANAKRRGILFDLTLEEFVMLCDLTGYMDARGRQADELSIDRRIASKGYTLDNLRVITVARNSRKAAVDRKIDRLQRLKEAVDRAIKKLAA